MALRSKIHKWTFRKANKPADEPKSVDKGGDEGFNPSTNEESASRYQLPKWFLQHCVKTVVEVSEESLDLRLIDEPLEEDSSLPLRNVEIGKESGKNFELSGIESSPKELEFIHSMSHDAYLELRDTVAFSLTPDTNGKLNPLHGSIGLETSVENGTLFAGSVLTQLARDLKANYVSFDLEDLEDVAIDFRNQDRQRKSNVGLEKSAAGLQNQELEGESPERNVEYALSKFYFGTPKTAGRHGSKQSEERSKRAFSAILEAPEVKNENAKSALSGKSPPLECDALLVLVGSAKRMYKLKNGYRLLARIRDLVQSQRVNGKSVIAFFVGKFLDVSCSCQTCKRRQKKTGIDPAAIVKVEPTPGCSPDMISNRDIQRINIRQLKRTLCQSADRLVSPDLVAPYSDMNWTANIFKSSSLHQSVLSQGGHDRIHRQILGRALGRKIEAADIQAVLLRLERSRESADSGGTKDSKAKDEDFKKYASNDYEKRLVSCIIKPGNNIADTSQIQRVKLTDSRTN